MSESKRVRDTHTRTAQIMTPNDANVLGKVFGGAILSLIDLAASAAAQKYAGVICVTASFDRVDFHEPIDVGDLVELDARITYVGRTSLEVTIDVFATHLPTGRHRHSNTARVTMVAIDKEGKPTPVPRLTYEDKDEKLAVLLGAVRRRLRQGRKDEMARLTEALSAKNEEELDTLLRDADAFDKIFQ